MMIIQDIEREKAARIELEKTSRHQVSTVPGHSPIAKTKFVSANGECSSVFIKFLEVAISTRLELA
ncbi:hypothetical protein Hanom_Chr12g01175221 [Helianthus anomalus]